MRNCIFKENTGLVLFAIQNLNLKCDYRNLMLWSKFIDSFRFDDEAACSLIFIDHPAEYYIGMSARTDDLMMLSKKMKRYSEGLAYLLIYHFPEAHIRVLEPEECINVVMNMTNLGEDIPVDLTVLDDDSSGCFIKKLISSIGKIKITFVRSIDPRITFDKLFEFYGKYYREKQSSIEIRMGVKPVCDDRILAVLENPVLAYAFNYYPSRMQLEEEIQKNNVSAMPEENFDYKFLNTMGVPDDFVDLVCRAESASDLFDNPYISLISPQKAAELILLP